MLNLDHQIWKEQITTMMHGPWFIKETNKNGGRAIQMCTNASDCIALASNPQDTHVRPRQLQRMSPLGRYDVTMRLFFCPASVKWSDDNLTPEAQLTIERTKCFRNGRVMEELEVTMKCIRACFNVVQMLLPPLFSALLSPMSLKFGQEVDDHTMIKDAVSIVFFPKEAMKKAGDNGSVSEVLRCAID